MTEERTTYSEPQEESLTELAARAGVSRTVVYKLAKKLGRRPTMEEIKNRRNGRPRKY